MTKTELSLYTKLLKDNKDMKEQLDYLVESQELMVDILAELINKNRIK